VHVCVFVCLWQKMCCQIEKQMS